MCMYVCVCVFMCMCVFWVEKLRERERERLGSDLSAAPQAVAIKLGSMLFSSGPLLTPTNLHVHVCWIVLVDYSMILCSFTLS